MNKYLTLLALLACATVANAACAANASGADGSCVCNVGYWGTNAEAAGTCNQCGTNSTTNTPAKAAGGNTDAGATAVVCDRCPSGFYMTALASGSTAAACTACPTNSTNDAITTAVADAGSCTKCKAG